MCKKIQLFRRPGSAQALEIPPNAKSDSLGVIRDGDFELNESIQGEIAVVSGYPPIEFTGTVLTIDNGKVKTFRPISPSCMVPELSRDEVYLEEFDYYYIKSVD